MQKPLAKHPVLPQSVNLLVCLVFGCKVVPRQLDVFLNSVVRACFRRLFAMCMGPLGRVNVFTLEIWISVSSVYLLYCLVCVEFGCSGALPPNLLKC